MTFTWKHWLILALVSAAAVYAWNREHRLRVDAQREAEAAQLTLDGQLVEAQQSRSELKITVADLLSQNELLRESYESAVQAAHDAKPVMAAKLKTGPITLVQPPAPAVDAVLPHPGDVAPLERSCILRLGDLASIEVEILELRTKLTNTMIAGTAQLWRETPLPRAMLGASKFESSLSHVAELAPPAPARWGAQALVAWGPGGFAPGLGVMFPPWTLPLVGWRVEAAVSGVTGPGKPFLLGSAGIRL